MDKELFDWAFAPQDNADENREVQNSANVLAMAFVNPQPLESVYELPEAFANGILFPNLDKPFHRGKCR